MISSFAMIPARRIALVFRLNAADEAPTMQTVKYVFWQEGDFWFGYLEEFPDYWTQGETLDDLIEHIKDLYVDMSSGRIPGIRRVGELILS